MIITDITPQKKKNRLNIYIDNKFYCGLEAEIVLSNRLKIGTEITEEKIKDLALKSDKEVAKNKALVYISKRCKSTKEVKDYLIKKGYLQVVVDEVTNFLKEYKYLDDEEYQKIYINANKYKGKNLIKYQLISKGIDKESAQTSIDSIGNQEGVIQVLLEKYLRNKEKTKENISKAYRHLIGKGFDTEEVLRVINRLRSDS